MAKHLACALTHVRHEDFFLEKWIAHYGAIVGREHLYIVIDGDDWEPRVPLDGLNVEVVTGAPRRRIRNDRWAAREMSGRANKLRKRYHYVIRGDVDEYVVIDPARGAADWEAALTAVDENGYVFALGLDIVQGRGEDAPLRRAEPVIGQRRFGFVADRYTKPFVISRWANWAGGAHRLLNRPVKICPDFVLFHLALCDAGVVQERAEARGGTGQHPSFTSHNADRDAAFALAQTLPPLPFDEARTIALADFPLEPDGSPAKRPRASRHPSAQPQGLWTEVPDRFAGLV